VYDLDVRKVLLFSYERIRMICPYFRMEDDILNIIFIRRFEFSRSAPQLTMNCEIPN
jgi:hypothetical protein